ncbi:MAG: hypothetical protein OHK0022_15020 [Roseiflexaceae bacterium]
MHQRPVVFFRHGLGDCLMTLPSLRALTTLLPEITLICNAGAGELFYAGLPWRDVIEPRATQPGDIWSFPVEDVIERVGRCDLLLSLNPQCPPQLKMLIACFNPPVSLGFTPDFRTAIPWDRDRHSVDAAFKLVQQLDSRLRVEDFAAPPQLSPRALTLARQIYGLLPPNTRVLAVHPDTQARKMWLHDRLNETLQVFLERHPNFAVLVVGRSKQRFEGRHADRIIPCTSLAIEVAFSLVSMADLFLGIDSCMLHMADLCGVPGVGLFGPTRSCEFGFRFARHRTIQADHDLALIPVGPVLEALEELAP